MDFLEKNSYYLIPQPKYIDIREENGITLSSLWTIFLNKFRIKDNALLLSSKFNKHFNAFLNAIPIRDTDLDESWSEKYFFAIITTESFYETQMKRFLNEKLENNIAKFDKLLNDCCYDIFPNELMSSLPLDESFYINISQGNIWIISPSPRGFYYGIQSLVQIVENTLFHRENFEDYIIIPNMTIVDFPGSDFRGFSVDLNSFQPTIDALADFVPILVKYKINKLVFQHSPKKIPYSKEEMIILQDVCNFHKIDLLESIVDISKDVIIVEWNFDNQFYIPNYVKTLQKVAELDSTQESVKGVLLTAPEEWNCPMDLYLPALPAVADLVWNPQISISPELLNYWVDAIQYSLFENKQSEIVLDFAKILQNPPETNEIMLFLNYIRKFAYENLHLLDVLEWALTTIKLEQDICSLKVKISNKLVSTQAISQLQQYSKDYIYLKLHSMKLFEVTNRIKRGECESYFQSHESNLRKLVESWMPKMIEKLGSNN